MFNINSILTHYNDIGDVSVAKIRSILNSNNVCIIRGLFAQAEIILANENIRKEFLKTSDVKHDPKDVTRMQKNMQKLTVGGTAGPSGVPRFVRMFYNPFTDQDIYAMHSIFFRMTRLRNKIFGLPLEYTTKGIENEHWTNARINHYPSGGGFMAPHRDTGTSVIAQELGLDLYLQILLIMTRKGSDYKNGGAYFVKDGKRVFYEDNCELGDIVIYDGKIIHGVEDVDPLKPLDLSSFDGRRVAFVTLLKHFKGDTNAEHYRLINKGKISSGKITDGL